MEASNPIKPPKAIRSRWPGIVNGVQLFHDLTVQLIKLFRETGDQDERVKEIERLLSLREEAVNHVTTPTTEAERDLLKKCKQLNDHLNELMQEEKKNIQKDLKDLKVKKESTTKYVNPYSNYNPDGMFYDRKK